MQIEDVPYEVDGTRLVGRLAFDEYRVGPRPAVLLCHEGPGLDEHVKGRAVRLASLGCVAFAAPIPRSLSVDHARARSTDNEHETWSGPGASGGG